MVGALDTTAMRSRGGSDRVGLGVVALAVAVALAGLVVVTLVSGDTRFVATGDTYPGALTPLLTVTLRFVAALCAATTVGALAYTLICTRVTRDGRIGPDGFSGVLLAGRASVVWFVASILLIPVSASDASGADVFETLSKGVVGDAISAAEQPKAWIVSSVAAAIVVVVVRLALSWVPLAIAAAISAFGALPAWMIGNAGQGRDHDLGTSAAIVAVLALAVWTGMAVGIRSHLARTPDDADHETVSDVETAVRRYTISAAVAAALLVSTAPVLAVKVLTASSILTTGYGRLAVGCAAAVVIAALSTLVVARARRARTRRLWASVTPTALIAVWATAAAMAVQPAPTLLDRQSTIYDIFLGYELPGPPTLARFLTFWRFDFVTGTAAVVLAALYVWGVVRLRRRGDSWPVGRSVSWLIGCAVLLIATSSGVAAYGSATFSVHMGVHMTLNMFVPVLFVLGGPVTLALRALPPARNGAMPGPREWITTTVHSAPMRALSNPAVAVLLFVLSLYAVYFTPLFDVLVRYHWGHELMNIHFLITGYLYYWVIIGIDPGPKRLPHLGRLGLLFAVMPFHAFFGIATMTMNSVIGEQFYRFLTLPWVPDLSADQRVGGALAWASSEVPLLLVVVALVTQWARQDRRVEAREDRSADVRGDDELDAYNAMLAELARTRR